MSSQPTPELSIAVIAEVASPSAAVLLGFSGLMGGIVHYGAVLARWPEPGTALATAVGFFLGILAGTIVLSAEALF